MPEIIDFFTNFDFKSGDWFGLSLRGVFVYIFILWIALVIWVARDVVGRTRNLVFQIIAILLATGLNIFGLLLYLIIRPQKTLLENYQDDLEHHVLAESGEVCPKCEQMLPLDFRFCPHCSVEARQSCQKCKKLVSQSWSICPYCGAKKHTSKKKKA